MLISGPDCTLDYTINNEIDVNDVNKIEPNKFTKVEIEKIETVEIEELTNDESEILNLKYNILPKGLAPQEDLFGSNCIVIKSKMEPLRSDIEECNIGTKESPKLIKISKTLPQAEKLKYISLFKEFQDIFAWNYEYLKSYDTSII